MVDVKIHDRKRPWVFGGVGQEVGICKDFDLRDVKFHYPRGIQDAFSVPATIFVAFVH